jgi:putative ABC transport system permease protein
MSWTNRLSNFLRPRKLERELDAEIEFHLRARIRDNVAGGMSEPEARRDAARRFGNRTSLQEETREVNRVRFLEVAWQDLRYALRGFRHSPGFTLTAAVSLALGIGANAALFSVVDTLLLRALPYRDADHLVYVSEYWPHEPAVPGPPSPDFANWRTNSKLAEGIAAYGGGADALNLIGWGEPERIQGTMTTSGLLDLIGARMALGRDFTEDEDRAAGPPVVILSYRLWQRKFGGAQGVLGKLVQLGGIGRTVVGVLPSGFAFPDNNFRGELLVPMALPGDSTWRDERSFRLMRVIARVKPGVSPAALKTEFTGIVSATASLEPPQMVTMRKDMEVRVTPLRDWLTGGVRQMVLVLQAVVAMLLLIACLNVASLQVARAAFRRKEMALRAAVGAGRGRLIRQLLTESLLLGVIGGGVGLALGYLSLGPLRAFLPEKLHLADGVRMDGSVLWFTLCIAIFTGILAGIAPALAASRPELQEAIKQGRANPARQRLQGALVIAEIAIATVLLVGCGLFVRTFVHLASVDPGFRPEGVLTLRVSLPEAKYADAPHWSAFFSQLLGRAQAIPGVESAAIGGGLPLIGTRSRSGTWFEGRPDPPLGGRPSIPTMEASTAYFQSLGIPILRGRAFNESDDGGAPVAIVNQAFAERFFPGESTVGKRIQVGSRTIWREIVGIAGNVQQEGHGPLDPFLVYEPLSQFSESEALLILKTSRISPEQLVSSATAAVHQIDPNQPVFDVATMEERLGVSLSAQRANMTLMSVFAALALILAAIGIFAVTAYFVSQRTHELGIRFALGATRSIVLKMILGRGMRLAAAGLILGITGALAATRAIRSLLEGVQPNDPVAFSAAAVLFGMVATAACLIPAVRASRVDTMVTLRED